MTAKSLLRTLALIVLVSLLSAACGGGSAEPDTASGQVIGIRPTPTPTPLIGDGDTLPAELSFADKPVVVEGATTLKASAGESLTLDYLVLNPTPGSERYAVRATASDDSTIPTTSKNVRVGSRDVEALLVNYMVPRQAEVGDVIKVEILVANTAELSERDTVITEIEVIAATGERPFAGDDNARTTSNERVTAYVVGNDTDPDGNIDYRSTTMITGGFRAVSASVDSNGTVTYVPYENVKGEDKLLYEICDAEGRCDTGVVTITILDPVDQGE